MDTTIAIVSELISSIALIGVVITLFLESRQLRTSQIQASRTLRGELIRLAMDYPDIASVMGLEISPDDYPRYAFLGLLLDSWEIGYSLSTMSAKAVQVQARTMFNSDYARTWWAAARKAWDDQAATKAEREFFALVDGEFAATTVREPGRGRGDETSEPRAE
jgi:uncharacterized protein DUF6082